jgi:anti-anti-sigma factor
MTTELHPRWDAGADCRVERRGTVAVVRLIGEVDAATTELAWPLIDDLLADQGLMHLEIYLSETTFFDSTGIRMLISADRMLRSIDGDLVVSGVSPFLARLFATTGLDQHLDLRPPPPPPHVDGSARRS